MDFNVIITFLTCIIFLFIFGKIFIWPLKNVIKLVFNSILGGLTIYIINMIGANFGFHIGLNLLTSVVVGFLGIPGAALLIILKIILRLENLTENKKIDNIFSINFYERVKTNGLSLGKIC